LGNEYDNMNYEIEDIKTGEKDIVKKENIISYFG